MAHKKAGGCVKLCCPLVIDDNGGMARLRAVVADQLRAVQPLPLPLPEPGLATALATVTALATATRELAAGEEGT